MSDDTYQRLRQFFDDNDIAYREFTHSPEGRCDVVSEMRGNDVQQAAKAMVIMVKLSKKTRRYYLAVVPGDRRVDLEALRRHARGIRALFAPAERAERLLGCPMGAVPPLSFNPDLELVMDPRMLDHDEIFFNAGCLDRSFAVDTRAFVDAVRPEVLEVAV